MNFHLVGHQLVKHIMAIFHLQIHWKHLVLDMMILPA